MAISNSSVSRSVAVSTIWRVIVVKRGAGRVRIFSGWLTGGQAINEGCSTRWAHAAIRGTAGNE
jgi:hypothetical protein